MTTRPAEPSTRPPDDVSDRSGRLRLLAEWLDEMTPAETAAVAGMPPLALRSALRAEAPLTPAVCDRVDRVAEATRLLRTLLAHDKIVQWYRGGVPRFGGLTPLDLLRQDRVSDLENLVNSYFDPSYA